MRDLFILGWNGTHSYKEVEDIYEREDIPFELGKAITLREGKEVTIIGTGKPVGLACKQRIFWRRKGSVCG